MGVSQFLSRKALACEALPKGGDADRISGLPDWSDKRDQVTAPQVPLPKEWAHRYRAICAQWLQRIASYCFYHHSASASNPAQGTVAAPR
jgi:hypothetical protein